MLKYTPIDASHVCNISCTHTAYMQHSVAKAIFGCDLRDFQYLFFGDILSNCRHYVSLGHETRVSRKHNNS